MRRFMRDNGLSLVMLGLFLAMLAGQTVAGYLVDCQERSEHHQSKQTFAAYLTSPQLGESIFENWESEFLQMAAYVVLTAILYQRGSAESRPLPGEEGGKPDPQLNRKYSWAYRHSLSLVLFSMFAVSFGLHAISGVRALNEDEARHGGQSLTTFQYLGSAQFWFESLQNWQSEFLAVLALIVLSIFLRHEGSPESKELDAPNSKTG